MWHKSVVLALAVMILLTFCGCARGGVGFSSYLAEDFRAEVRGKTGETELRVAIKASRAAAGWMLELEYLAPPSLEGLCLKGECGADGTPMGEVRVTFCGVESTSDATCAEGLLLPLTVWLRTGEHLSAAREGDGYRLCYEDRILTLTSQGIPQKCTLESSEFWIVWWENSLNQAE